MDTMRMLGSSALVRCLNDFVVIKLLQYYEMVIVIEFAIAQ